MYVCWRKINSLNNNWWFWPCKNIFQMYFLYIYFLSSFNVIFNHWLNVPQELYSKGIPCADCYLNKVFFSFYLKLYCIFPLPLVPLYAPSPSNHHTVVHVHESFFLFAQSFHPLRCEVRVLIHFFGICLSCFPWHHFFITFPH